MLVPVAVLAVLASLAGGAFFLQNRRAHQNTAVDNSTGPDIDAFTATDARDPGSAWFCPGGTAITDGLADVTVALANPTSVAIAARIRVVAEDGTSRETQRQVPAGERVDVRLRDVLEARRVSASIEADAGGLVAEQMLSSARGVASVACSATAASQWYFAEGTTVRGARTQLWLSNPYAEPALVDLSFLSEVGPSRPRALQGLTVAARGMRVVELGEQVRRRAGVATAVTARTGKVVAAQLVTFDGTEGTRGLTMTTGSPERSDLWIFPAGRSETGWTEQYVLANPDPTVDIQANVSVLDASGEELLSLDVDVPAESRVEVPIDAAELADAPSYAVIVTTEGGKGIVAQRSAYGVSPALVRGLTGTLGATDGATRWLLAAGGTSDEHEERIVVFNPTDATGQVSIRSLGGDLLPIGVGGTNSAKVAAFGWREVRLGRFLSKDQAPMLVESDVPVVVERLEQTVAERGARKLTTADVAPVVNDATLSGDATDATTSGSATTDVTSNDTVAGSEETPTTGPAAAPLGDAHLSGGRLGAVVAAPLAAVNRTTIRPATSISFTTKPSTTKPSTTRPSTTKPSTTKPSTTKPSRVTTTKPRTTRAASTVAPVSARSTIAAPTNTTTSRPATSRPATSRPATTATTTSTSTTTTTTTIPVGGAVALGVPTKGAVGASSSLGVRLPG